MAVNSKSKKNEASNIEEYVSKSEAFIIKNKNIIIGVILAICVVIAGVILYKKYYSEPRENKAQVALIPSERYFENDLYQEALAGDSLSIGFLKIIDQYKGTDAANLAKAYAGICYAQTGEYEKAISYLDGFKGGDAMVGPAMKGTIGNCYAQLGKMDKAISYLEKAAKEANDNTLSPIYLLQAGQLLIKQGDYSKALNDFETIKKQYARSYQALDIDRYIEQAKLFLEKK